MHGANSFHHLPVGIERAALKTIPKQAASAPGTLVEPTGVRQKQSLHRRAHRVLIIRKYQVNMVAHKAPRHDRHAGIAAAVAHQLQKLPPVVIGLKDDLFSGATGRNMVKAGDRSPNALHGAPFSGINLRLPIHHD